MIGSIRGVLSAKASLEVVVDVQGLGFEIVTPMSTFSKLPEQGDPVELYIHLLVRENLLALYGFATSLERRLFRVLIEINGIGARIAISMLSHIAPEDFARHAQNEDLGAFTQVPGIGKKTAERILLELRDKLAGWSVESAVTQRQVEGDPAARNEARSALITLGFKAREAEQAVERALAENSAANGAQLLRIALKNKHS